MGEQTEMMMTLLRDLMNQAALASNTFKMVNEYFNCSKLIKRCFEVIEFQARSKKIKLEGPVLDESPNRFYFK